MLSFNSKKTKTVRSKTLVINKKSLISNKKYTTQLHFLNFLVFQLQNFSAGDAHFDLMHSDPPGVHTSPSSLKNGTHLYEDADEHALDEVFEHYLPPPPP